MKELESIYIELQPKLYRFFYAKTSNKAASEDLTQDVFYEAARSIQRFQGNSTLSTWMFTIAQNLLKKYYGSSSYEKQMVDHLKYFVPREPATPEKLLELQDSSQQLLKAIQTFDPLVAEIILLRLYGELSFKDIAELTRQSENYARVTFHRAKLNIQKELEGF